MPLGTYKELIVWKLSCELAKDIYQVCITLPADEKFGLCSQMKRASVSIPSNIAEGYRRNNRGEYIQFLGVALGSAAELETQLILTQDIFGNDTSSQLDKVDQIQRMLASMISKLKNN